MAYYFGNSERGRGQGRASRGRGQGRGFGGGRMAGMPHRRPLRVNAQASSSTIAKSSNRTKDFTWQHGLYGDSLIASGLPAIRTGTKLYVSNLDYGVTNKDIKELFSKIGDLKRYAIHYDKNGRSNGSAEVVFIRRSDALAAVKRYNNVVLDGKPMKIEVIGANLEMPVSARVNVTGGANGRGRRTVVMMPKLGQAGGSVTFNLGSSKWSRGGSWHGRGHARSWGRSRVRKQPIEKPAHELDRELENYHAEAMHLY